MHYLFAMQPNEDFGKAEEESWAGAKEGDAEAAGEKEGAKEGEKEGEKAEAKEGGGEKADAKGGEGKPKEGESKGAPQPEERWMVTELAVRGMASVY